MRIEPIIEFKNFSWKYRSSKNLVLDSINLKINKGDFLGIMGPTGAGKSTLCSCMNGLIPLKTKGWIKGTVEVFGVNTRTVKMHNIAIRVGLIFQDPETQFIMMTVEDELAFGLEALGLNRSEIKERIEWALKLIGLEGFEQRTPEELSGGQKQRVAIASIMAMRPEILILDEPTSDLDPHGKYEVFKLLKKIKEEFDITIILVSHETKNILEYCNRLILINDGKIVYDKDTSILLQNSNFLNSVGLYIPIIENEYSTNKIEESDNTKKESILKISNLSYIYPNNTQALKNINLTIYKGEFLAIIGKNGSGKTTLIKHFNGLLKPQTGEVYLNKRNVYSYSISEIAQIIGYCYQNPDHQLFKNTIKEEIQFGLKNLKFPKEEVENRYLEIVNLLDLRKFEEIYESTIYLSKGIRQRLALASVLALKPEILIIDEPTTGQDFFMIIELMNILEDLNKKSKTIIIVTHNAYVIKKFSKQVLILDNGDLIAKVPTAQFLQDESLQKISAFIPP